MGGGENGRLFISVGICFLLQRFQIYYSKIGLLAWWLKLEFGHKRREFDSHFETIFLGFFYFIFFIRIQLLYNFYNNYQNEINAFKIHTIYAPRYI
jgi:hypothetical protein